MKAAEITDSLIAELDAGKARHARLNFANGDMVGHTGKRDAAVMAVEAVDLCLSRILPVIERQRGAIIVTADHGNADEMFELDSKKQYKLDARGRRAAKTSHTLNAVPFYVYAPSVELSIDSTIARPTLANVAATVLQLMGLCAPADFEPGLLRL
jgi:2,3-bisphosphoglycerate-independent phosphoglycerate mutase